jgi:hypothetical protein
MTLRNRCLVADSNSVLFLGPYRLATLAQLTDSTVYSKLTRGITNHHWLSLVITVSYWPSTTTDCNSSQNWSRIMTDGQLVSQSSCQVPSQAQNQTFDSVRQLRFCWHGAPSLTRGRVCHSSVSYLSAFYIVFCQGSVGWLNCCWPSPVQLLIIAADLLAGFQSLRLLFKTGYQSFFLRYFQISCRLYILFLTQ